MTSLAVLLLAIPAVVFSEEHQAMVKTAVGEAMPQIELFDATGRRQPLPELRGEKATVVAVIGGPVWMTETMLNDLRTEIATGYSAKGVRVVAVSLASASPLGQGVVSVRANRPDAAKLLGEGRMPRVYVLDASGAIAWLDIEYSVSTRRELIETLDELTGE